VLASDPTSVEAYNDLGNVLCDTGRGEDAIEAYRAALVLHPRYARPTTTSAPSCGIWGGGRGDSAYQSAIAIDSRIPDVHNNLGVAWRPGAAG